MSKLPEIGEAHVAVVIEVKKVEELV